MPPKSIISGGQHRLSILFVAIALLHLLSVNAVSTTASNLLIDTKAIHRRIETPASGTSYTINASDAAVSYGCPSGSCENVWVSWNPEGRTTTTMGANLSVEFIGTQIAVYGTRSYFGAVAVGAIEFSANGSRADSPKSLNTKQ
ncbi:hypothetical protein BKA62DRAFT_677871 [Auriculariales sp. MPI-PUGE-AT-0066]|nr:hypothetical protein BKA62DRAFT_677871 [Auriculariales sp. MPI-PUGE-AT-0066]